MPQPYLVPVRPTFSRNAQRRGVLGSTSTLWVWPLIVRVGISFLPSCGCGSRGKPHAHSSQTTGKRRYSRGPFRLCLFGRGRRPAPRPPSRELDVVSLERERADALAGRREEGIEHGRRSDEDCRLTDAAPEAAGWHDDDFDLRHFTQAHHVVAVEVSLLDGAVLDRAGAEEQRREAERKRARHLSLDQPRIEGMAAVGGRDHALDPDPIAVLDRDLGGGRHVAAVSHLLGETAIYALRCRRAPADFLG